MSHASRFPLYIAALGAVLLGASALHAEIVKAVPQPEVREAFAKLAMLVSISESPEAFAKKMQAETDRLGKVIHAAGIEPE